METIWRYLNGKKSAVAAIAGCLLTWTQTRGWVDGDTAVMLASMLTILTGVAVGHKIQKSSTSK